MALWGPFSQISWFDHLRVNPYVQDITQETRRVGQKISSQTKEIVASNAALARNFGEGFDSVNETLEWGLNRIDSAISGVEFSIRDLSADFNYNMGLVIVALETQSKLMRGLLEKLDEIHQTLKSPLLTQARELYNIGCDRLRKGLLDKALEALHQAEAKNDTDFFTQYQLGNLYLYGVNGECNVIDLVKARKHLLDAARYANAEIRSDKRFVVLASQAYFHASIACYASKVDPESLKYACVYAEKARDLFPPFEEAQYHLAKYYALMGQPNRALEHLDGAVLIEESYAVKASIDPAFDGMRCRVEEFQKQLREKYRAIAQESIAFREKNISIAMCWVEDAENSPLKPLIAKLEKIKGFYESGTFMDYVDVLFFCWDIGKKVSEIEDREKRNLKAKLSVLIQANRPSLMPKYGYIRKIREILSEIEIALTAPSPDLSYEGEDIRKLGMEIERARRALALDVELLELIGEENKRIEKEEWKAKKQAKREEFILSRIVKWGKWGAIICWPSGCVGVDIIGCVYNVKTQDHLLYEGLILGALLGGFLGFITGIFKYYTEIFKKDI